MNYSRKQLEALGEPLGDCVTRKEGGRIIYGGGGSSAPSTQTQVSDLPDWAKPYAQETLEKTKQLSAAPYQAYGAPRIAGFSPMQQQAQQAAAGLGTSGQLGTATGLSTAAGLMGLGANYQPGYFGNQFRAPAAYQPSQFAMLQAQAPELQQFQMGPAERVGTGSFTQPGAAAQYMSPFIEQALAPQLREAQRTSEMQRAVDQAQAVRSGAFGGSRQAIIEAERQRNLGTQLGDIRARGLQTAFEQAQGLYGTEAQRQLAAQQANQQAGLTVGQQNLAALLGTQQLGAGQSMQAQLANQQALQAAQQAAEQSRQYGYGQGMTAAQQRAQFGQAAQQLAEQSRQYGAGYGLQGLGTALQAAGQLGNLGQAEFGQAKDIIGLQSQLGAQQQALRQQGLTQAYQDFLNEQNYPYKQLGFMSDMIRGLPLGQQSTKQIYEPPGSMVGQIAGLGTGLLGLSSAARTFGGFAEGGQVDEYADGGVTSNYSVDDILGRLSDVQLQQSRLAALNRGDNQQLMMIDNELAERASLRSGLGGAFNTLPEDTQEAVTEMAGGGIVAFANGGDSSYDTLERKRLAQPRPAPRTRSTSQRQVSPTVHQGINQISEQTGVPREALEATYARILQDIESKDAGDIKAIQDMVEKSTGGSREVKESALGRALADFGFKWAAAAAKPGAKFLSSAAEAGPTLAASMAESTKLAREMDQNDLKLRTAQKQFELARRADNRKEAGVFAGQIEQLERQQEMLNLKRRELEQTGAYQQGTLANQRAQLAQRAASDRLRGLTAAANLQRAQASILEVGRKAGLDFDNSRAARDLMKQLTEQHGADKAKYFYNQQRRAYISEATQGARAQAESDVQARNVFDLLGQE